MTDKSKKVVRVHFMGIGGSGASGVARIAKNSGFEVSGCDLEESPNTIRLAREGIEVVYGHSADHLSNCDLLVHTPAVFYQNDNHPEYLSAVKKKIAITWEDFMAKYLMSGKYVIAVTGTHGKGTTSAILSRILESAGIDPTCEIGANLLDWSKKNYRVGNSKYFLCEADEFREKFLIYNPNLIVITSIEMDHPEYFRDFGEVLSAFRNFAEKLPKDGKLIINGKDDGCRKLGKELVTDKKFNGDIVWYKELDPKIKLKLPGEHLRSDAAGAAAAAKILGASDKAIKEGIEKYSGAERRFEFRGVYEGARIYDDYAHHPTAVEVNIAAAREIKPKGRVFVVFQPHMYTRLGKLFNEFVAALKKADKVLVTDVYTRREKDINKPTGKELALAIGAPKATYVGGDTNNIANFISRNVEKGDIILMLGAGDIYKVSNLLLSFKQ